MGNRGLNRLSRVVCGLVIAPVLVVAVQVASHDDVHAATGCTSGSVSTSSVIGRTFTGPPYEVYDYALASDTTLHRFTRVLFTASGSQEARCTWVAPAGIRKASLLVVGGGGAGGTKFGGGGGGGGVAMKKLVPFPAGNSYDVIVGVGGSAAATPCDSTACNGANGTSSSVSLSGATVLNASGGGGGGGDKSAGLTVSCSGFAACGGGGGGAGPSYGSSQRIAGGSGAGSTWTGLAIPNGSYAGGAGYFSGFSVISGGGGGAAPNGPLVNGSASMGASGAVSPMAPDSNWQGRYAFGAGGGGVTARSEEHTSELQSH